MARLDVVTTILCDRRAAQLVHAVSPQSNGSGSTMAVIGGGSESDAGGDGAGEGRRVEIGDATVARDNWDGLGRSN